MHRFYSPKSNFSSKKTLIKDKNEIHHIKNVLRLKKGQTIFVFNDQRQEAEGTIIAIGQNTVEVEIKSVISTSATKAIYLILACAIPKKSKFETIIEKCTELGVDEIIPLKSTRTELSLSDTKRIEKKIERYRTVAINAAKQSKRSSIPIIHTIMPLNAAIRYADEKETMKIMPSLLGKREPLLYTLQKIKGTKKITFFIGPEGDFTEKEYKSAQEANCCPVTLGKATLKVETAAISVISFANLYFDQE